MVLLPRLMASADPIRDLLPGDDAWGLEMHPHHFSQFLRAYRLDPSETARIYAQGGDLADQISGLKALVDIVEILHDSAKVEELSRHFSHGQQLRFNL